MLGWSLGTAIAGGNPTGLLVGIGSGLAVASIPFSVSANKKIKRAVDAYNKTSGNAQFSPAK